MTIAISCNLSDGVILGADSAITVEGTLGMPGHDKQKAVLKVYKSGHKVFELGNKVGVCTFGVGMLGSRSIGSHIGEFKLEKRKLIVEAECLQDVCEELRSFFQRKYSKHMKPLLEKQLNKDFDDIPIQAKPKIGFYVGGYSRDSALSEVWLFHIPEHTKKEQLVEVRAPGNFGSNWSGQIDPINRLIKGFDRKLIKQLVDFFVKKYNVDFDEEAQGEFKQLVQGFEGRILYDVMPLQEGIDHVKYLLDVVIHNTRFVIGAPICDAPVSIAVITGKGFDFVVKPELQIGI